jgi:hypothetical protein
VAFPAACRDNPENRQILRVGRCESLQTRSAVRDGWRADLALPPSLEYRRPPLRSRITSSTARCTFSKAASTGPPAILREDQIHHVLRRGSCRLGGENAVRTNFIFWLSPGLWVVFTRRIATFEDIMLPTAHRVFRGVR